MKTGGEEHTPREAEARECLARSMAALKGDGVERRHESLMEMAEEMGLERSYAEQVYELAEEEELEPIYAFQLIRCGIGVRELTPPDQDMEEFAASQEAPPDWVGEAVVALDDAVLERRLRSTFRRFRAQLEAAPTPVAAVESFLQEQDVGLVQLRTGSPRG